MTIGSEGTNGARTSAEKDAQEILDTFFSHGHTELDTARIYAEGTTEQVRRMHTGSSNPISHKITFITRSWPSSM
jgi:aryl-alcohol dehydrogenase-like predicted oxidoreductase